MNRVLRISKTNVSNGTSFTAIAGFSSILVYLGSYLSGLSSRVIENVSWNGAGFTELLNTQWQVGGDPLWANYAIFYKVIPTPATGNFAVSYGLGVLMQFDFVNQNDPFIDSDTTVRVPGGTATTPNITTGFGSYGVAVGTSNTLGTPTISSDNSGMVTERSGQVGGAYGFAMASVLNDAATVDFTISYNTESVGIMGATLRYQEQILASPLWF